MRSRAPLTLAGALVATLATGAVLCGCPILAGIDHDYTSTGADLDATADAPFQNETGRPDAHGDAADAGTRGDARRRDATPDAPGPKDARSDVVEDAGGDADATSPDDVVFPKDVGDDACPAACSVAPVTGWTLVAYDPSGAATCPSGFSSMPVQTPTSIGTCACSDCSVTTPPDCESGLVTTTVGSSCSSVGPSYSANHGACVPGGIGPATSSTFTAPTASGGACQATATKTNAMTEPGLVCTPSAGCATAACEPALQGTFQTCLFQAGDQTCPTASMTKHAVGTAVTTTCDACTCTTTSTGCTGLLHIYSSATSCSGSAIFTASTGGSCEALTGVASGDSYEFTGSPTGVGCTSGSSNATDMVTGQGTICCGG